MAVKWLLLHSWHECKKKGLFFCSYHYCDTDLTPAGIGTSPPFRFFIFSFLPCLAWVRLPLHSWSFMSALAASQVETMMQMCLRSKAMTLFMTCVVWLLEVLDSVHWCQRPFYRIMAKQWMQQFSFEKIASFFFFFWGGKHIWPTIAAASSCLLLSLHLVEQKL